jgi:hypothetical protein
MLEPNFEHSDELDEINPFNTIVPIWEQIFMILLKKLGTSGRNGIGLGVIGKDHIFPFWTLDHVFGATGCRYFGVEECLFASYVH